MSKLKIQEKFTAVLLMVFLVLLYTAACSSPDRNVENIEAFTRLYGYVKYFYPGDEAVETDWDRFAVYGVKRVEKAATAAELKKILAELFLPIAPALVIHESGRKVEFSAAAVTPPDREGMKVVAWQHYGVATTSAGSIYRSIRLNRINKISLKGSFGTITNVIDAAPYRGKEIKLKAAVKVGEGIGQMWLRVDRDGKEMGFFDNMDDRPIKSNEWKYYEITGQVADDARQVAYGCFLKGAGRVWVDDFQVYIKGKEDHQWKPVTIKNPDFEGDKENTAPEGWGGGSSGYSFQVTSETAAKGGKSVLIKHRPETITGPLFDIKPAFGEFIAKDLGGGLSCVMPIALYGTEKQTYPGARESDLNRLRTAVEKEVPKELSGSDLHVRLAGIVIGWNVFQHFFPYFDVVKTDWKASLTEALTSAYNDKTAHDFLKTLRKFSAGLKDGHTSVFLKGDTSDSYCAPVKWDWIEGQLVITGIYDEKLTNIHVGDVVVSIDGVKAKEALEEEERYVSAGTDGWRRYRSLVALLRRPKDSAMSLKIKRDGTFYNETLPCSMPGRQHYSFRRKEGIKSKKIAGGIYYLNLDKIPMNEINGLMPELEKAKSIICDLRGYPKSNHELISHLLKEDDTSKWMFVPQVIYPDYEKVTYQGHGWHMKALKPTLTAKVIFITDGRAISYAESYMGYIEHYRLATIVGQPTAGTNGNATFVSLPGGYRVSWTGMRVLKHDGSTHHGVGILPHVRVERTLKGVIEGRDEFLEKAIEIAKSQ